MAKFASSDTNQFTASQRGDKFASRMQDGESIANAWLEAVWYADNNNHPSAAATGVVDPSLKMSDAALQKNGLAFIGPNLTGVVALGANEQIVPLRTDFRSEWGQDLTTSQVTRSVVANRIVFGRTINGTPVVGNGSRVVVTFANDESVESYQYDWPKYEVTTTVHSVLDSTQVLGRVQRAIRRCDVEFRRALAQPQRRRCLSGCPLHQHLA